MAERLTTLAKRLRPFIAGMVGDMAAGGAFVGEGPGIDVVGFTVGLGGDTILIYDDGGLPVAEYALSAAGLLAALAAAAAGQIVYFDGPFTITTDCTIPANVELRAMSRYQASIIGTITVKNSSILTSISVAAVANSADPLYGVIGPTAGTATIRDCYISAIQSGAGNAYAVGAINGLTVADGNLNIMDSYLYGSSVSGDGYAGRSTRGIIRAYHGREYGSTDRWVLT